MDECIVKALNHHYIIKLLNHNFDELKAELYTKLQVCTSLKDGYFEAFFDVQNPLDEHQIEALFLLCQSLNTCILGFVEKEEEKQLRIIKEELHGGQKYNFDEPILILGNIPRDTYVSSTHSLYVMGDVRGNIDLIHQDCIISASSFNNSFIRIYDSTYQNMTMFAPSCVYYNKRSIIAREYKEERMWVK